jgi:hypothetical protein
LDESNALLCVGHPEGAVDPLATTAVRPIGGSAVRINGGLLHEWQTRNREVTIPHTIEQLEKAGNVENLRRLTRDAPEPFQGKYPFLDTDLYKTLEGFAYELRVADDEAVRAFFDEVVDLLVAVQTPDGYLNSRFQDPDSPKGPWEDLAWGHELYNLGHLIQAAVAAHRQLGDDRLLGIATRFADLVVTRYGEEGESAVCGHPEVEMALVELYRVTGNHAYLRQAELFIDRRGHGLVQGGGIFGSDYFQDHVPLRELSSPVGHAVRMMYLAAGATDVLIETGDSTLEEPLQRIWNDLVARKLYITGGLGSRHTDEAIGDGYELPSERAYAETCAAIGLMQWAWRMFLASGDSKALDIFETVLYNAYAVGVSAEGDGFFYDNPLQRRADHEQRSGAEIGGESLRRSWFGCPCCPPNIVRWMAQLGDYVAAESETAFYLANFVNAHIEGRQMALTVTTDYPWDGRINIRVDRAPARDHSLKFRVPSWAGKLSGAEDGWFTVTKTWTEGEEFSFTVPMPVRAHGSHPHLDATRGAIAVARGPLVYAAEQVDNSVDIDDVVVTTANALSAALIPGPAELPRSVALNIAARHTRLTSEELYPRLPADSLDEEPASVTLIPYFLWGNRTPAPMRIWIRRKS